MEGAFSMQPIALDAYNQLATQYSELAVEKAENAYLDRPMTHGLLGDVQGLRVLDAGCGPGINAKILTEKGAWVTGVDVSPRMLEEARKRCGERVVLHLADLAEPLSFLEDASFDRIFSSLAIDYVEDWMAMFREFWRILIPGGILVFSAQHPTGAYNWYQPARAQGVQYVTGVWTGFGAEPVTVPDYYRSFADMVNPLLQTGFVLERVEEAQPIPECRTRWPEAYEEYMKKPSFIGFRTVKPTH